ncbi:hypothetical protein, partial [Paenibacillus dendritiformis]|uniref:hypothetical protein n=1 Tax=Paenibacillus dendritiformis TaxID=130049 RepID=UPI001BCB0C5C
RLEKSWSFADFDCRMGVSREMVQFSEWWKYPFPYSKLLSQQPEKYIISSDFSLFICWKSEIDAVWQDSL